MHWPHITFPPINLLIMPDIADRSTDIIEQERSHALTNCKKPAPKLARTGECANCGADISSAAPTRHLKRWCDAECRDEWVKY